ncbi:MAG: hypothetical protein F4Z06_03160 [Acidimicrobiia bacterium]|nr:hypothetical protein [Acidimicrobiia bacterium]MXZ86702.1 hypothetical protein [Acidimicrobiia bacterium]MYE74494.1 hypothetical protein [Acidimicrobiia bacterium]MYG71214.1 hypothetical protein [Acidimicrobiia bacterium]MYJ62002.1 hypothetical protein [Acidimicrobiia bacterium]
MTSIPESEVYHITEEELDVLIEETLQDAGVELEELRRQYTLGRFESDKLRRTWFVVAGLGRA